MEYIKSEIEKLIIYLTDSDNQTHAFPLARQNNEDSIIWERHTERFDIKIITDREIRTIIDLRKSDTIIESADEIKSRFSDSLFENKMNQLISREEKLL